MIGMDVAYLKHILRVRQNDKWGAGMNATKCGKALFCFAIIFFLIFITSTATMASLQVFPGAEGFGTAWSIKDWPDTTPDIYRVDTLSLNRSGSDPELIKTYQNYKEYYSSLKGALSASGARIIVFEISGYINWSDITTGWGFRLENPYVIVAGSTSPSPGITIKGATLRISTHHVLIENLRFRIGDIAGSSSCISPDLSNVIQIEDLPDEDDTYSVVLDHLSLSWSVDKILGTYYDIHDITVSNSILAEPLDTENPPLGGCYHPKGSGHNYMMLLTGAAGSSNISIIKNFLSNGRQRNPYVDDAGGDNARIVFVNNLVYDAGDILGNMHTSNTPKVNIEGNVYIKGPHTTQNSIMYLYNDGMNAELYVADNSLSEKPPAPRSEPPADAWTLVGGSGKSDSIKAASRTVTYPISLTVLPNYEVENQVISNAGAYIQYRNDIPNDVDSRIIDNLKTGKGDYPKTAPTYPILSKNRRILSLPINPYNDDDSDGYANIEEWLHEFKKKVEGGNIFLSPPKNLHIDTP